MSGKIRISGVEYPESVGKRIVLIENGKGLIKSQELAARSGPGKLINAEFGSAKEAFEYRLKASSRIMFVTGTFHPDSEATKVIPNCSLVAAARELERDHAAELAALTKEYLEFRPGRGLVSIDIDPCKSETAFPAKPDILNTADDVRSIVLELLPEAQDAPMLILPSSSSLIENVATGNLLAGAGGWRVLLVTSDASLTPLVLETLHLRAWARQTWCYAWVSKAGCVLVRSLADQALARPTQPDYPTSDLGDGLRKLSGCSKMYCLSGPDLDPHLISLGHEEKSLAQRHINDAKHALAPASKDAKTRVRSSHIKRLSKEGVPPEVAAKSADALYEMGLLVGSDFVEFDDRKMVQVAELIGARGSDLDGKTCPDPLEPGYDSGRSVAKFFWNNGLRPGIFSFARGGRFVPLSYDIDTACAAIEQADGKHDTIVKIIALTEFDGLEEDLIYNVACKSLGLGRKTRTLKQAVQTFRAKNLVKITNNDESEADEGDFSIVAIDEVIATPKFPQTKVAADGAPRILDHGANIEYLLDRYGFDFRYDEICKEIDWAHPRLASTGDNSDTGLHSQVIGLCNLNDVPSRNLGVHLTALADRRTFNPVTDHLKSLKWDGKSRFKNLASDLRATEAEIASIALRVFLLQACAAADHAFVACSLNPDTRPHFENVVVFVGAQGIGKTKGIARLLPTSLRSYFKEGMVLDPKNKDLVKQAVSGWVTELGELDATFRKADIEALKAFLSNGTDELRMPYSATWSRFRRRTVFVGTVNDEAFLADRTGNRRFLPLKIGRFSVVWNDDEIDQLWAEAWSRYSSGEEWWPSVSEEAMLQRNADRYRVVGWIEETLSSFYDWEGPLPVKVQRLTATEIFKQVSGPAGRLANAPRLPDLKDIAAVMKHLWSQHDHVVAENGELFLHLGKERLKVHNAGGKASGWLVPAKAVAMSTTETLAALSAKVIAG